MKLDYRVHWGWVVAIALFAYGTGHAWGERTGRKQMLERVAVVRPAVAREIERADAEQDSLDGENSPDPDEQWDRVRGH